MHWQVPEPMLWPLHTKNNRGYPHKLYKQRISLMNAGKQTELKAENDGNEIEGEDSVENSKDDSL